MLESPQGVSDSIFARSASTLRYVITPSLSPAIQMAAGCGPRAAIARRGCRKTARAPMAVQFQVRPDTLAK
jgi:hypothetical protein